MGPVSKSNVVVTAVHSSTSLPGVFGKHANLSTTNKRMRAVIILPMMIPATAPPEIFPTAADARIVTFVKVDVDVIVVVVAVDVMVDVLVIVDVDVGVVVVIVHSPLKQDAGTVLPIKEHDMPSGRLAPAMHDSFRQVPSEVHELA